MSSQPLRRIATLGLFAASAVQLVAQPAAYSHQNAQEFLRTYCATCHQGKSPAGGLDVERLSVSEKPGDDRLWTLVATRVGKGEMPPTGVPAPDVDQRAKFTHWISDTLHAQACAAGITPGPSPIRRLNRDEYGATIQSLLSINMDLSQALPADGGGGEGFDNAAETLTLSPIHSEKYMEAARMATDFASKEFKSRRKILIAEPGPGVSEEQAAHTILQSFLSSAFRRPATQADIAPYLDVFQAARKLHQPFESAIFFAVRASLVSPFFLYHFEPPNRSADPVLIDQYALASRLSYFLWGSMPDDLLFDVAAQGKLQDPIVLKALVERMLKDDRSLNFADRFVGQWLETRELGANKIPDLKLFPTYANEELRSDIRYQPVLFFRELLSRNLSLLNIIDSKFTIETGQLAKHYQEKPIGKTNQQPGWVELPAGSHRGGLVGMAAVLAVSSYPHRTSPVLRGAWILNALLGTPPPPPPPNVPSLEDQPANSGPMSMRDRLSQHRANPVCANCHSHIDPLGFALENFDAIGRWRDEEGGKPVDNTAELPDGTKFAGPEGLKQYLMDNKDLVIRNLTRKMLGYALGRGLTLQDSCVVDNIMAELKQNDYKADTLIEAIVLSMPFRYQAAGAPRPGAPHPKEERKP